MSSRGNNVLPDAMKEPYQTMHRELLLSNLEWKGQERPYGEPFGLSGANSVYAGAATSTPTVRARRVQLRCAPTSLHYDLGMRAKDPCYRSFACRAHRKYQLLSAPGHQALP